MSRKSNRKAPEVELPSLHPWDDLFGHEQVLAEVRSRLEQGNFPQVVLFDGREGVGKRKLLAAVLGLIFCHRGEACGVCEACRAIRHGFHPDVLWIESEGTIKVADADKVQEHLSIKAHNQALTPTMRVVVMVDIEELTDQAANRLLKTLEEPPAQTLILLTTSRMRQLLPTVRSRLVWWRVQTPAAEQSLSWLEKKAAEEGISIDKRQLQHALERALFAPGKALRFLREEQGGDPEALRRLETLLLKPLDGSHLAEMQELLKQQGWKAPELAQRLEFLLNRYYKWSLGITSEQTSPVDFYRMRHRRKILQQVYRAGGSGHNHLNSQLIAEAWSL